MIRVFVSVFNEAPLLRLFLEHAAEFADMICVQDHQSTDKSAEIARNSAKVRAVWSVAHQPDTSVWTVAQGALWERLLADAASQGRQPDDWYILLDADEFLHVPGGPGWPDLRTVLGRLSPSIDVVMPRGWYMHDFRDRPFAEMPLPEFRHTYSRGMRHRGFDKPVIFRARAIPQIEWTNLGHHALTPGAARGLRIAAAAEHEPPLIELRHMRYLGLQYTVSRNLRMLERWGRAGVEKELTRDVRDFLIAAFSAVDLPT